MLENRFLEPQALRSLQQRFARCIVTAEATWGAHAFKRGSRDQSLAGLFDAQMIALDLLSDEAHASLIRHRAAARKASEELFEDPEFDESVRRGTNTPQRLRYRTEKMHDALSRVAERV